MDAFPDTSASLRRLFVLRSIAIAGQALAIAVAVGMFDTPLPVGLMAAVIAALVGVNLHTWMRLRRSAPVGMPGWTMTPSSAAYSRAP